MSVTSKTLIKEKLESIANTDKKKIERMVILFELPFVVDESDIRKWFSKCGGVKSMEVYRSGALVFSTALIELQQKKGVKKAIELASNANSSNINGEFDIIIMSAIDFLEGKKIPRKNRNNTNGNSSPTKTNGTNGDASKKTNCKMQ